MAHVWGKFGCPTSPLYSTGGVVGHKIGRWLMWLMISIVLDIRVPWHSNAGFFHANMTS